MTTRLLASLRRRLTKRSWDSFYADNRRKLLRLEADEVASKIEQWGYRAYARECRDEWANASEGKRSHWRSLAKRGF